MKRGHNPNAERLKGFIRMKSKEKYFFPVHGKMGSVCVWYVRLYFIIFVFIAL